MANKYKAGNYANSGLSKEAYLKTQKKAIKSPSAPSAPKAPKVVDPNKGVNDAEKSYLKAMGISKEETAAQKALTNLTASRDLGVSQLQTSQAGMVPLSFITGQQAALTEQASAKSIPLTAQLEALQSKRQAATDIAKEKLSFAQTAATARDKATAAQAQTLKSTTKAKTTKTAKPSATTVSKILSIAGGWQDAAARAQAAGIDTSTDSAFDLAARKKWAPQTLKTGRSL